MNDNIVNAINSELKPLKDEITALKNSMMFISDQYEDIKKNHDASQLKISALEKENDGLLHTVSSLEHRCNQIEQQLQTWLNDNIKSSELFDDRYTVYRKDRCDSSFSSKKDGGGVLIAVSSKLTSRRKPEWETKLEDLWVILDWPLSQSVHHIAICAVYLPPPVDRSILEHFLDNCNRLLELSYGHLILGDFNLGHINWDLVGTHEYIAPNHCQILLDFLFLNHLKQHNNVLNSTNRILDLVISNNVPLCSVIESVSPLCNLDKYHPPLDIVVTNKIEAKLPYNRFACKFNFFKADYESINNELSTCDWNELFCDLDNVDSMLDILYAKIRNTIHKYVPKIKSKNNKYPPWFNNNLKKMLKEKFKLRQRYRKYNNPRDKIELHIISTRCSKTANICYNLYIRSVEDKIHSNPKYFWSYIKSKRGGNSAYPPSMSLGDEASSDSVRVCELFSKYFGSVYSKRDPDVEEQQPSTIISVNNDLLLTLPRIEYEPLLKKLKAIDVFKGAGPDGIHPKFIVACAENLVQPLLRIFNCSLGYGFFPTNWKVAKAFQTIPLFSPTWFCSA
ncbi:unnamed protein product [Colias eurytheme]|nr:unnamed protein product [Colias eurytheme]